MQALKESSTKSGDKLKNLWARGSIYDAYENLKAQREQLGSADDVVKRNLKRQFGQNYGKLAAGKDIGDYDLASQADVDRINALKGLLGQEDVITKQQLGDQDYVSTDAIQNLLKKFG